MIVPTPNQKFIGSLEPQETYPIGVTTYWCHFMSITQPLTIPTHVCKILRQLNHTLIMALTVSVQEEKNEET